MDFDDEEVEKNPYLQMRRRNREELNQILGEQGLMASGSKEVQALKQEIATGKRETKKGVSKKKVVFAVQEDGIKSRLRPRKEKKAYSDWMEEEEEEEDEVMMMEIEDEEEYVPKADDYIYCGICEEEYHEGCDLHPIDKNDGPSTVIAGSSIKGAGKVISQKEYKGKLRCNDCGFIASRPDNLKRHIRTIHEEKRPHTCHLCDETFGCKQTFQNHRATVHAKRRDYACAHCEKKFGRSHHLNRHVIRLHTRAFPYPCNLCTKGFLEPSELQRHLKWAHKA